MDSNNHQWSMDRMIATRRVAEVHEVNGITALTAQVSSLVNLLKAQNLSMSINQVQDLRVTCVFCGGAYLFDSCLNNPESVCTW